MWPLIVPVAVATTWSLYYYVRAAAKPLIYTQSQSLVSVWLSKCGALFEVYYPTFWLTNAHLQTIATALFRSTAKVTYHRELVTMPDSGTVALDWSRELSQEALAQTEGRPIVIILHGVTGGSQESYVTHVAEEVERKGWVSVVFNQRGCGDSEMTSPRAYCAASSDDCSHVVSYIHKQHPKSILLAIGVSLGANILVKYLGEAEKESPLKAAVSLAGPLDTLRCGELLNAGFSSIYSLSIASRLKAYVHRHAHMISQIMDPNIANDCRTVWDFDDKLTAPAFGYSGAEEYYRSASSCGKLGTVAVPLLCLNSEDDPIAPANPQYADNASEFVAFAITKRGGHVAWLEGLWPFGKTWADRVLMQFFEAAVRSD